ncbi:deoxyribonuclease IV [Deferrisoma camini]|uniref:deoxyribonuclease IV n=1 Tax=Deferrisoma camini TaxID=1035120 RepID=UPI00046D3A46|nr:deoxyribonuclease IV [Deferrisoma camini]
MGRQAPGPPIGAHVSVAGGPVAAWERTVRLGAEAAQVFPGSPRSWESPWPGEEALAEAGEAFRRSGIPVFVHAIYLVNPASDDPEVRRRSVEALARSLEYAAGLGARGLVVHVGHGRGVDRGVALERVRGTLERARERAERIVPYLLETGAGGKGSVGSYLEDLVDLARGLGHHTRICADTAHLFAAGLPVHTARGLDGWLSAVEAALGPGAVGLVHLNDSKTPFGSGRDRHENLGRGEIGGRSLARWVRHPTLRTVPFVIETPGFDRQGPDRRNLARARRYRRGPRR